MQSRRSLSHLSPAVFHLPILHLPGRADTIVRAVQIGGPPPDGNGGDMADRRLYIGRRFMAACLRAAEAATTSRAVVVGFCLHVRLVEDRGHHFEIATLAGEHIAPEDHTLIRAVLDRSAPGVSDIEAIHRDEPIPLGKARVLREVLYTDADARLIFEAADVLRLVHYCDASVTGWMQLHRLGLQVRTWQRPDGSIYDVCTVVGQKPESVTT